MEHATHILNMGVHKNVLYIVTAFNGHRNGYVFTRNITTEFDINNINCHGGITFEGTIQDIKPLGRCIGFDTCHGLDNHFDPEINYTNKERSEYILLNKDPDCIRNTDYCINECKKIIDQLT